MDFLSPTAAAAAVAVAATVAENKREMISQQEQPLLGKDQARKSETSVDKEISWRGCVKPISKVSERLGQYAILMEFSEWEPKKTIE